MQHWQMAVIIGLAIIAVAAVAWFVYQQMRTRRLRHHFGSEYDHTLTEFGDRRRAEAELARRQEHIRTLRLRPLSASDRVLFAEHWRRCQAQFVDDPAGALGSADRILNDILRARGYSVDSPSDRMADISAAYPEQASSYRLAHEIVRGRPQGQASTEELRKAFVHYRKLFDQILGGYDEELKRAS
jgi:hypothetical protein